jgi:hypothetical protein
MANAEAGRQAIMQGQMRAPAPIQRNKGGMDIEMLMKLLAGA